ncbi:MAG: nitric oxide reductase D protein [Hyphomicrobiaceae bacterium]
MSGIDIAPWEPEETVGKLWHALASRLDAERIHDGARADLSEIGGRLAVLFRGLGGKSAVEIKAVATETSRHRLGFFRKLGMPEEKLPRASFDGETLRLPGELSVFPWRDANVSLYVWLAACTAHAGELNPTDDPLRADVEAIAAAEAMVARTLADAPGFRPLYQSLCTALLHTRPRPHLPPAEAAIEACIRRALGDSSAAQPALPDRAPSGYRPFRPVIVWPDVREQQTSAQSAVETRSTGQPPEVSDSETAHRARRRKADLAERKDSFILHKFEALLSWAEFMNLNRRVEDDDSESAQKAADDQDEIGLGQISKAPAAKLKLHLDLAPEDADREALSGTLVYPEWDARTNSYLQNHVRVLTSNADEPGEAAVKAEVPEEQARIRRVRKQFEAFRPGRLMTVGHAEGDELDMERAVAAAVELKVSGRSDERVWRQLRQQKRDLAVSILLDVSRSTESQVPGHGHNGRSVIDIEREALTALAWGLSACGDDFAINAFSSLKRDRVFFLKAKDFGEPMSARIERRIAGLQPGFYTRLGAAIRHASAELGAQGRKRRLLLVITDGKPNDLDHYEGRHGIEDSRMAVREARRLGHAVFGITIDRDGKAWFPRIFGAGGFAVVSNPNALTQVLPQIYRHLIGA